MEFIFWFSAISVTYIYVGYPLLLKLLPHIPDNQQQGTDNFPSVTVIIPAYNEAANIESTIRNKLAQEYSADLLSIVVVSDESDDGTDDIVSAIAREFKNVRLIRQSPRQGKTAGLNLAMNSIKSDIVVFSDANSHYAPDALRQLTRCFQDSNVGYVTGKMVYTNSDGSLVGDGCSAYMKYENYLRKMETLTGSVIGVDGGIDAIRRELYQPMNSDQLPDFVLPLKVVTQGKRVAYCEQALLNEDALNSAQSEFKMRVRVSLRAYWAMWDMRHLFNPFTYGVFSLQLFSHKLLRYLAFLPLMLTFFSSILLSENYNFYGLAGFTQFVFYSAAAIASGTGSNNRWLGLANYFCLVNFASAVAFVNFIKGEKIILWKPRVG